MGVLPYVNNPFIMSRVDGAGTPIDATRTAQFRAFQKTGTQAAKDYPVIRGLPGNNFGTPWVKGLSTDPVWHLVANTGYSPDSRAAFLGTTGFHAPDTLGDLITGTTDSPFCVFDAAGGFTVFGTVAALTGTHQITCSSWGVTYHNTNGLHKDNPLSDGPNNITSRGRLSDAMVIRRDFVDAAIAGNTSLGHVLHMFQWQTDETAGFCHPMVDFETHGVGFGAEGERVRIKPSVDLTARGMSPFGLVIARTLQEYGCYIGDNAGALSSLKAQQDGATVHPWAGLSVSQDALVGITWDDFEVVVKGWQGGPVVESGVYVVQHKGAVTNSGTSCTVTLDAPATAGNYLVAIMSNSGNNSNAVIPTGFSELDRDANVGGCNQTVATKIAAGGETSVTFTCGTASSRMALVVYEVHGSYAAPSRTQWQTAAVANTLTMGPDAPKGLEIAALSLGTDASASVPGTWDSSLVADESLKTTAANNNVQLVTGSIKQNAGTLSPKLDWTGTAVNATGFLINFPKSAPAAVAAHYRYASGAWSADTRYLWNGSAYVATL